MSNNLSLITQQAIYCYSKLTQPTIGQYQHHIVTNFWQWMKVGKPRDEIANKMYSEQGLKVGMLDGNLEDGYITVGNGLSYINSIRSVNEVVEDLMQGFK